MLLLFHGLHLRSSNSTDGTSAHRIRRSPFQIIEFDGLPSKSWNSSVVTPNPQPQQQHHYQQHQHQCQKQTHEQEQHLHFLTAAQKRDFPCSLRICASIREASRSELQPVRSSRHLMHRCHKCLQQPGPHRKGPHSLSEPSRAEKAMVRRIFPRTFVHAPRISHTFLPARINSNQGFMTSSIIFVERSRAHLLPANFFFFSGLCVSSVAH